MDLSCKTKLQGKSEFWCLENCRSFGGTPAYINLAKLTAPSAKRCQMMKVWVLAASHAPCENLSKLLTFSSL